VASAVSTGRFRKCSRAGAVAVLVGVGGFAGPVTSASAAVVPIQLLSVNDFHGRIDANTLRFAGTIETERQEVGADNTLLIGAGDLIGASGFASAVQEDIPTLDLFNEMGMATSAVGNHEFDQGLADLTDRVEPAADFSYLGANVYARGTEDPVLEPFDIFEVGGVTVGVIGVVTQETPSLVSPAGVSTVDFGDPVAAVNRVAGELTDGDAANGEADILVASIHEGAPRGENADATFEDAVTESAVFAALVEDISPEVDAILNGHTHQEYAWDAPVPGEPGRTRPVLQTGNYAQNVGEIRLSYDTDTGTVTGYTVENVPTLASAAEDDDEAAAENAQIEADLLADFPEPLVAVEASIDEALAFAEQIGSTPVGSVTADITTAFSGGDYSAGGYGGPNATRDNRAAESSLGNLVAEALLTTLEPENLGGAEISLVNPGGLRAELLHGGDGVITYAEANAVLPFVNNLFTTTLTGAQLVAVLEQQWQTVTAADGSVTVPSRSYLQLSTSANMSYTFDPDPDRDGVTVGDLDDQGEHIISVTVDGAPVLEDDTFRVGSFSFLLQGGDNFTAFTDGTDVRDSGLIDRDAWIDFLKANPNLSPDFAKHAVAVTSDGPLPGGGETAALTVSSLDMTSLGAPANSELQVGYVSLPTDGSEPVTTEVGTFPVTAGTAEVTFTMPGIGSYLLVMAAEDSGTVATLPLVVVSELPSAPVTTTSTTTSTATSTTTSTVTSTWTAAGPVVTQRPTKGQLANTGISAEDSSTTGLIATALILLGSVLVVAARRRTVAGRHSG
jgi:5'-nucleotidase